MKLKFISKLSTTYPICAHLLFTDTQFTKDDGLDQLAHQNQDAVNSVHHRLKIAITNGEHRTVILIASPQQNASPNTTHILFLS